MVGRGATFVVGRPIFTGYVSPLKTKMAMENRQFSEDIHLQIGNFFHRHIGFGMAIPFCNGIFFHHHHLVFWNLQLATKSG